jgi:hypothetical protein
MRAGASREVKVRGAVGVGVVAIGNQILSAEFEGAVGGTT